MLNVNEKRTLFHKAIIESGGASARAVHPANSQLHEAQFQRFLSEVGCESKPQGEVLPCLRQAPSSAVTSAQTAVFDEYNPSVRWAWQPVLDNDIISRRPLDAWKSGDWHKVPVITGHNHNEGTMYVPKAMQVSNDFTNFFATLLPQLSEKELEKLNELYPDPAEVESSPYVDNRNLSELGLGEQFKRVEAAYGQYAYVTPVRQTAKFLSDEGTSPVYQYHWALNKTVIGGANHGDQIWYETMSPLVRNISSTDDEIARYFNSYITSFIVTPEGDPNKLSGRKTIRRPVWSPYHDGAGTMLFGAGHDIPAGGSSSRVAAQFVNDKWAERESEFWDKISEVTED